MKLLITGASGFLGKYIVAEALRQGHQVRAVVRPASDETRLPWHNHPEVELARIDLRQRRGITDALQNVDAVIHLAAVKEGGFLHPVCGYGYRHRKPAGGDDTDKCAATDWD